MKHIFKILLIASTMTAVTVSFMFSADAIVLQRAIIVFFICYIVFFGSFAYLYKKSKEEGQA